MYVGRRVFGEGIACHCRLLALRQRNPEETSSARRCDLCTVTVALIRSFMNVWDV